MHRGERGIIHINRGLGVRLRQGCLNPIQGVLRRTHITVTQLHLLLGVLQFLLRLLCVLRERLHIRVFRQLLQLLVEGFDVLVNDRGVKVLPLLVHNAECELHLGVLLGDAGMNQLILVLPGLQGGLRIRQMLPQQLHFRLIVRSQSVVDSVS